MGRCHWCWDHIGGARNVGKLLDVDAGGVKGNDQGISILVRLGEEEGEATVELQG